ncbi:ARP2/3 complex, 21kDa subunit (p21-Arc) [Corchorus olitorius]|uniref:ARP2/3 complex, 21kDa subunit (p21-Arc) n=1 Tax=Corchorus olitorius TaxID=93759 RepID=A0A1R3JMC9_9ROSI|nr:ARP2/3 complex, 21kDa subunit (p21-Arc) [Corchorus olitorius]
MTTSAKLCGIYAKNRAGPATASNILETFGKFRLLDCLYLEKIFKENGIAINLFPYLIYTLLRQVYHSSFVDEEGISKACGCPLLPLKSHIKGPAPVSDQDRTDIVDEAITFFRANVFFRNFDIKSPADKLLIYLTFYINIALKRLEGCRTLAEGTKAIINLGLEKVPVPGESGFPFPGLFALPQSQKEAGSLQCLETAQELSEANKRRNKRETLECCL